MSDTAVISAIIPAYNSAGFITAAIDSIRAQTRPVDEIIVVDDGSTDASAMIIENLGGIHYLYQANAGPSATRNRGIQAARGDLIAFLDADDQWTRTKIEQQLAVMKDNPEVALVAGDMAEIDVHDHIMVPSVLDKFRLLEFFTNLQSGPVPNALSLLLKTNFIPTGTVLVKRTALESAGSFPVDIRYGEDLELWARVAAGHPVVCLPEILMLRRQHGENVTGHTEPLLRDLVTVMTSIRDSLAAELRQQGIDPDRLVAQAWGNLGYWQFSSGLLDDARQSFRTGLKEKPILRNFIYATLCSMPETLVYGLRQIKQKIAGTD